ncbi:carbamoyl phosphate synthase large subunit [Priestia megaterium]|uniref:carbamoyl phosphate synthase large subunit n=1 Tax=Priestia megaterium TaxID=1404 RepID=UPI000BF98636|nr:carbamoyl phosphate synthase large subunit [Priestia megaterium]MCM3150422.1 carbamoyl phosphate synthase large subunit [Priestia megaterium]PFW52390.1 carbamoyl phosphate synthase large subunit [Priestia megaterium]
MPKDQTLKKILVIGSGPIVIGQAAEFDYSGTQACLSLKEEGYEVILINNNPATIMTDTHVADRIYFEPLTVDCVEKIIAKEKPDGLLATLGGQTGLNLALELHEQNILPKYDVKLLGTPIESIKKGESREEFRALMNELNEPVPESEVVTKVEEALAFAKKIGFPVIVRPAYTLGGTGGGIAHSMEELEKLSASGLRESAITQCLIEKSIAGFKEVEYEVMRDVNNTCITICNMENIDPVGVHTGDSVVVAPSQTLTDVEYQMLRSASVKIISSLGIIGGCNIQFALDPKSKQYYLIEVNPRVSRSSALASKATGYPIAKIAAKLSVGYTLHELLNPVTGDTYASFEPALDYVVVKFPRWPFDKFFYAERTLGTQMKATGEVMAIDRNFTRSFQKALSSLEIDLQGLEVEELQELSTDELKSKLGEQSDERIFVILELLRRGTTPEYIHEVTQIDYFYLTHFAQLIKMEASLKEVRFDSITAEHFKQVKEHGFTDAYLANVWNVPELDVRAKRKALHITPSYKMVDTCAAEFESSTAYFYSSYYGESEIEPSTNKKVAIIGSGPIRIGQGVEFDYSSVHGVLALEKEGYETILINNNPETVSTDFEVADRLYFEPVTVEDVLNVLDAENVTDVIVQYGGQTAISLVKGLEEAGVNLLGITNDVIDALEDRDLFYKLLDDCDIPHIPGEMAKDAKELVQKAKDMGFPLLIRPSYVIGGKGMLTIQNETELQACLPAIKASHFPMLIDAYFPGKEAEVDVVADGKDVLIPTIVEHIEKAGVHSGDSYALLPAKTVEAAHKEKMGSYAQKIVNKFQYKGIMNIQYVIYNDEVYMLEVNPRASRTVPVVSKVCNTPLVSLSTQILLGKSLSEISEKLGLLPDPAYTTIKFPVFSTSKLSGVDPLVGPEMKSTGEGIAISSTIEEAAKKVFHQYVLSKKGAAEVYINGEAQGLEELAQSAGLTLVKDKEVSEWVKTKEALLYVSLQPEDKESRMSALKHGLMVMTEAETASLFFQSFQVDEYHVSSLQEWFQKTKKEVTVS